MERGNKGKTGKRVQLIFEEDLLNQLDTFAAKCGKTRTAVIEQLVAEGIERHTNLGDNSNLLHPDKVVTIGMFKELLDKYSK